MTRTVKNKKSSLKHSSKIKSVMLDIPRSSSSSISPATCMLTRFELDKLGNKLDIDDVLKGLRIKYTNLDPCALVLKMLPAGCIPKNWQLTAILGKGAHGVVLGTRSPSGEFGALKITHPRDYTTQNAIKKEYKLGDKFHEMGIGVEVKGQCSFTRRKKKLNALHMSRIDGTISSYLQSGKLSTAKISNLVDKIFNLLSIMKSGKCTHADFHLSNIGYIHSDNSDSSNLVVIDFGRTTSKKAVVGYDIIKLLICTQKGYTSYSRSLGNTITPKTERIMDNLQKFEELVRIKAKEVYKLEFPSDLEGMLDRKDKIQVDNYDYL